MVLHKIVNGIRIDCTPEEEESIKIDWERNRIKKEQRRIERERKEFEKKQLQEKIANTVGISIEELKTALGV